VRQRVGGGAALQLHPLAEGDEQVAPACARGSAATCRPPPARPWAAAPQGTAQWRSTAPRRCRRVRQSAAARGPPPAGTALWRRLRETRELRRDSAGHTAADAPMAGVHVTVTAASSWMPASGASASANTNARPAWSRSSWAMQSSAALVSEVHASQLSSV
jgi:hypothetical protein